jgi:LysM repeat protein
MLTRNMILGSVALTGAVLLSTGCTTSNTLKGSQGNNIPPAEILPMTEFEPMQEEVIIEETTVVAEVETTMYKIQKGDNLGKIARKFGVGVADICELNDIKDKNKIKFGQEIEIPAFGNVSSKQSSSSKKTTATGKEYIVKPGDCLSKIASAHGIKTADLAAANQITNYNSIFVGQKLIVSGATKKPTRSKKPQRHIAPAVVDNTQAPEMNFDEELIVITESPETSMNTAPVIIEEVISTPILEPNKHVASETEDLHAVALMWDCSAEKIAKFNNIPVNTVLEKGDFVLIPNVSK